MELINNALKITLKEQLETLFPDANVFITNDITLRFMGEQRMLENDLIFVLSCGSGQTTATEKVFTTTPFLLTCTCPLSYKKKNTVAEKLFEWFKTYALKKKPLKIGTIVNETPSYYAAFDVMTPYNTGSVRLYAGQHVTEFVISGNVVTCETNFNLSPIPTIKLNNVLLENIFNFSKTISSIPYTYTSYGKKYQKKIEEYVSDTYTIDFLYDEENELHNELINSNILSKEISINDNSFSGYLSISYTRSIGKFTSIQLVIAR